MLFDAMPAHLGALRLLERIGLVHTTGGYALYAMHTTANSFGLRQQTGPSDSSDSHRDVYACVADAGWITGHTYIVSPMLCLVMAFALRYLMLPPFPSIVLSGLRPSPERCVYVYVRVHAHVP